MKHKDLSNPTYVHWRAFLAGSDTWARWQIEDYQLDELRRVISTAYNYCPAYRSLYDAAGVHPGDICTLADIQRLPMVTKEQVRGDLNGFTADVSSRSFASTTGSSGTPLTISRSSATFAKELASKAHQYSRLGWREGDKQFVLRGDPVETEDKTEVLYDLCELRCSSYHLIPAYMRIFRHRAWEYGPEWMKCYPSTGYIFARYLESTRLPFPPIKGILCASEPLYDFQKRLMAKVFNARVFSHYGHTECAVLAGFCEYEDTYHVLPQYGYVELIDDDGELVTEEGQVGEIVATSFIADATMFIRYRTGDYAEYLSDRCSSCGRPYQIWKRIIGRKQDILYTGDGSPIPMTGLHFPDGLFRHVARFQFHQKAIGLVEFRYVPMEGCTRSESHRIREGIARVLKHKVTVTTRRVAKLPQGNRGKFRLSIYEGN